MSSLVVNEAEASLGYMRPHLKDRKWREGVALLVKRLLPKTKDLNLDPK